MAQLYHSANLSNKLIRQIRVPWVEMFELVTGCTNACPETNAMMASKRYPNRLTGHNQTNQPSIHDLNGIIKRITTNLPGKGALFENSALPKSWRDI